MCPGRLVPREQLGGAVVARRCARVIERGPEGGRQRLLPERETERLGRGAGRRVPVALDEERRRQADGVLLLDVGLARDGQQRVRLGDQRGTAEEVGLGRRRPSRGGGRAGGDGDLGEEVELSVRGIEDRRPPRGSLAREHLDQRAGREQRKRSGRHDELQEQGLRVLGGPHLKGEHLAGRLEGLGPHVARVPVPVALVGPDAAGGDAPADRHVRSRPFRVVERAARCTRLAGDQ